MEANNMKAMHEALRQISRVAVEMTRGTITGDAPSRKEVDRWAMQICEIIDSALTALRRESATTEKSSAVGNSAAMREALIKCYQLAYEWEANEREGIAGVEPGAKDSTETLFDIQQITTAALDAPPRNCDTGTPKEQADRHRDLCLKHGGCSNCPRNKKGWSFKDCILEWEQMPYEEGGSK